MWIGASLIFLLIDLFFHLLRMINIDPVLCDVILTKQEYNTVNKLARDQILHR